MANAKITALSSHTTLQPDHIFPVVDNPAGAPITKKITWANVVASFSTVGILPFPATQIPSADANTLDDYEEGTWTPVITFSTPGNLNVVYSSQLGFYTKMGNVVNFGFIVTTSTFTHTTASGNLNINGLPFTCNATYAGRVAAIMQGYTKANFTQVMATVSGAGTGLIVVASGSGQTIANLTAADTPSGGTLSVRCGGVYIV
jgi:hypothetical protein